MAELPAAQLLGSSRQPVWITWGKAPYQLGVADTPEEAEALKLRFCTDERFRKQIMAAQLGLRPPAKQWFPEPQCADKTPPRPEWFRRLPAVRERLREVTTPFLDRAAVEELFGVSPSTALRILRHFGARHAGKSCVIEREAFLRDIDRTLASDEYQTHQARVSRVADEIARARADWEAREHVIPSAPDVRDRRFAELSGAIRLEPGKLTIDFFGMEDFLRQVAELVFALQNDYDRIERLVESVSGGVRFSSPAGEQNKNE